MRRKDREINDPAKIREIIAKCDSMRIGFFDGNEVYIIPLNYGFEETDGSYTFYFHAAKEGRKISLIRECPDVGFELDTNHSLVEGDTACRYGFAYQSVIGNGVMSFVEEPKEKIRALCLLMRHQTGKDDWHFSEEAADTVCVFQMRVTKLSCKERVMPGRNA